jgi:hypothetical protein
MATVEVTTHASGNNNDHVRRHNLSAVLGLAHRTGGLSRAQLTRATGLNRSTIADLERARPVRGRAGSGRF